MKLVLFIVAGILALTALAGAAASLSSEFGGKYYSGKVALTEQEYKEFKLAVVDENVKIKNINVLSSTEPIVVDFTVRSKDGFNYGKERSKTLTVLLVGTIAGSLSGGFIYLATKPC